MSNLRSISHQKSSTRLSFELTTGRVGTALENILKSANIQLGNALSCFSLLQPTSSAKAIKKLPNSMSLSDCELQYTVCPPLHSSKRSAIGTEVYKKV